MASAWAQHVKGAFDADLLDRQGAGPPRDRLPSWNSMDLGAVAPGGRAGGQRDVGAEQAAVDEAHAAAVLAVEARRAAFSRTTARR